ncbi:MAG TPA: Uma2 family endonuclease [Ktedonobacteraceae bacterium]
MAVQRDQWISLEDFLALDHESLDQKYEYLDGHIYALAVGSNMHSLISGNIYAFLHGKLKPPCFIFASDMKVQPTEYACFFPDISVSCDPRDTQQKTTVMKYPKLVIEVLSPTTEKGDRGDKFRAFQQCPTVQEYVLVSQEREEIEVFKRHGRLWVYGRYEQGEEVELTSINVIIPLKVVYENIVLPPETRRPLEPEGL